MNFDPETFGQILRDFSLEEVISLCEANSEINERICQNDYFWQQRFLQDFGPLRRNPKSWKLEYQYFLRAHFRIEIFQNGRYTSINIPSIRQISVTDNTILLLAYNGQLFSYSKILTSGLVSLNEEIRPILLPGQPLFHNIVSGEGHHCLLDTEGKVWGMGSNQFGQLGAGPDNFPIIRRIVINDDKNLKIQQIAVGKFHTLFLDVFGQVWGCGDNDHGQLSWKPEGLTKEIFPIIVSGKEVEIVGLGEKYWKVKEKTHPFAELIVLPHQLILTEKSHVYRKDVFVSKILAGDNSSYVQMGGFWYASGQNNYGSLGIGQMVLPGTNVDLVENLKNTYDPDLFTLQGIGLTNLDVFQFSRVQFPPEFGGLLKISCSDSTTWFLSEKGMIYQSGQFVDGELASFVPFKLINHPHAAFIDITLNSFTGFAIDNRNQVWVNNFFSNTSIFDVPKAVPQTPYLIDYLFGVQKAISRGDKLYLLKIQFKIAFITPRLRDLLVAAGEVTESKGVYQDKLRRQMIVSAPVITSSDSSESFSGGDESEIESVSSEEFWLTD